MRLIFSYLLFSIIFSNSAFAFCSEPNAPDSPSTLFKPSLPYCLRGYSYSGTHDCEDYEIDNYKSKVADYIRELNDYISEVQRYHDEAVDYAKCEAEDVKNQFR